jgi:kinesin family protein 5
VKRENPNKAQFRVTISFLEIYMEQITDLLSTTPSTPTSARTSSHSPIRPQSSSAGNLSHSASTSLPIREDPKIGIFVEGLTQVHVNSMEQLLKYVELGIRKRNQNSTGMNKNSSRSHAILQIFVEQRWVEKETQPKTPTELKKYVYRKALCTVVDLAGSERLSKTGSEGMRLQEAKTINKSIAALSNCISALS